VNRLLCAVAFGACLASPLVRQPALAAVRRLAQSPIQHIVIVVQDNRSFDNLFSGYPGANTKRPGKPVPLAAPCEIRATFEDYQHEIATGDFSIERTHCPRRYGRHPMYGYVPNADVGPYFEIAQQYVLGDNMFSSTGNPAFEAHQYVIAAQAAGARDEPFGSASDDCLYEAKVHQIEAPVIPACFSYATLATELDAARLPWKYYVAALQQGSGGDPAWNPYGWISGFWQSPDVKNIVAPSTQFFTDVQNGNLGAVTWVTPSDANSDVSGSRSASGPRWVASIVNAVGESQFWETSAIVVTWSGYGGWYDHVPPPILDSEGLGFRVPLLVISPYAMQGAVNHTQLEFGSILRFVENTYGLAQLAASDARATPVDAGSLDYGQAPRPFVPIPTR
jgi:phospholipase C